MNPIDINASLHKVGSSQTKIAQSFSPPVTQAAVAHIIYGRHTSLRIAKKISSVTNIPVTTLWPGRYDDKLKLMGGATSSNLLSGK